MSATKSKALVVVLVCIALAAIWFAIPSEEPLSDPDAVVPEIASPSPDGRLAAAYETLKSVHGGGWLEAAYTVGVYGDPDEATEAILDLIENRADVTRESSKLLEDWNEVRIVGMQGGSYHSRIQALIYLGLTKTNRAEEVLLDAYKNPQDVVPNQKWVQVGNIMRASGYPGYADFRFFDAVTRRFSMMGLLVLDVAKYSPMLEEDFYASAPDAERTLKIKLPYRTDEEQELVSRSGVLLDLMLIRDVIREYGIENPEYLLNPNELKGDLTEYWDFQTETVVPRQ